jgi:hypothetical protein
MITLYNVQKDTNVISSLNFNQFIITAEFYVMLVGNMKNFSIK